MQVSARILGRDYGLTAEEMNRVLVKQGFLQGRPGDYSVTQKALQYAAEKDFHRGTGGYASYNRYWTTRTFDDSIKNVLNISSELIRFLYKGIIINHNKKLSQPTLKRRFFKKKAAFFLKRRFFKKKAAFFSWPGLRKEWC